MPTALQTLQWTLLFNQSSFIPQSIWTQPWSPNHSSPAPYTITNLTENVFEAAVRGQASHALKIWGATVVGLIADFRAKIAAAAVTGDFTDILSPDRSFLV